MPRPNTDYRDDDDDAQESTATPLLLLPSLIPPPSSPRAMRRTLSTAIIILFFSVMLYEAVLAPSEIDEEQMKGVGWTNYESVYVGSQALPNSDTSSGSHASAKTSAGREEEDEQVKATSKANEQTEQSVGTFSQLKFNTVETMRKQGQLSSYTWHQLINDWDTSVANAKTKALPTTGPGRLIIVGDIHGTHRSLKALLISLSYTSTVDTLLHVGDIVSKAPLASSLATVQYLRQHQVRGVRGNHDQGVIEWRNWMESYGPLVQDTEGEVNSIADKTVTPVAKLGHGIGPDEDKRLERGTRERRRRGWFGFDSSKEDEKDAAEAEEETAEEKEEDQVADLEEQEAEALSGTGSTSTSNAESTTPLTAPTRLVSSGDLLGHDYKWLNLTHKQVEKELGVVVPVGWEWGGQWFEIARHLPKDDFEYLRDLPLTLRLEGLDVLLVHAGLVPAQSPQSSLSTYSISKAPASSLSSQSDLSFKPLSSIPDGSIPSILKVEQNTLPFTLLNLRTLQLPQRGKGDYDVRKGKKHGTPWPEVWNEVMTTCAASSGSSSAASARKGNEDDDKGEDASNDVNGCEPLQVIYGHWAGRGLDVQNYSIGLDSGCVYGKRLSALVLPLSGVGSAGQSKEGKKMEKWRVTSEGFDSGAQVGSGNEEKTKTGPEVGARRSRKLENGFDSCVQDACRKTLEARQGKRPVITAVEKGAEGTSEATADSDDGTEGATSSDIDEDDEEGAKVQAEQVGFFGQRRAKVVSVSCAKETESF
ncbi:BQ2448_7784 [Microbotryum intermedium]|uniref:BQ2448_7784 protein n=1 Tax=Microbotryum intermedium TaxID=269621 RepID=A0A238FNJ7_9BASI|nr:BQ2448_7784 [Microbotryum intermedium]